MHKARHLAAEYKGAGIRDSLTNSYSNVGTGDVTKRLRWDTNDDAVSGKLKGGSEDTVRVSGETYCCTSTVSAFKAAT
jgi:hypothetical protein